MKLNKAATQGAILDLVVTLPNMDLVIALSNAY